MTSLCASPKKVAIYKGTNIFPLANILGFFFLCTCDFYCLFYFLNFVPYNLLSPALLPFVITEFYC